MTDSTTDVDMVKRIARTIAKAQNKTWTGMSKEERKEFRVVARRVLGTVRKNLDSEEASE